MMQARPYVLQTEFLQGPLPIALAHRGAHSTAPENTLAAFDAAWGLGYRYIETDVRSTSDGSIVVFHDANTRRMHGVDLKIGRAPLGDLLSRTKSGDITTLAAVLNRYTDCFFNIDVKDVKSAKDIYSVASSANALNRVCIGSFSSRRMRIVRRAFQHSEAGCFVATAFEVFQFLIFGRILGSRFRRVAPRVFQVPMKFGGMPLISRRFVRKAHACGFHVHVWTVNDEPSLRKALQFEVDGIITDAPELLKAVLTDLGMWV
ncbi:MAG TPA: glycerophosphodiester phosphodiesterase family protein [Acidobacteriaceae bacterium]|nr:glycerophosphodiester phosphodiesterase family protein [Acidobacteriaceae bacterium]